MFDNVSNGPELAIRLDRLRGMARARLRLRVEAGIELKAIRDLIRGDFVRFIIEQNVGYRSYRSIYRDMTLADVLAGLPGGLDAIDTLDLRSSASALLAAASGGEEVVGMVIEAAQNGVTLRRVDVARLEAVADFSPLLAERVTEGSLGVVTAAAVVERVEQLNCEAVSTVVATHGLATADAVDPLVFIREHRPALFQSIQTSGAVWNPVTETDIRLCDASPGDLLAAAQIESVEAMARQKARLDEWRERRTHSRTALIVEGTADDARAALMESWPEFERGATVRIVVYEQIADPQPEPV